MVSAELLEIIKKDFRQTPQFANFLERKGFKTIVLKNGDFIHEFSLGPFSLIKSFRPNLDTKRLKEIQEIADKKSNLLTKLAPNIGFEEKLLNKFMYKRVNSVMSPTKTLIADLTQDIDKIYEGFSENTRYKINRSIRDQDKIEIIQNPNNLMMDKFYENMERRMQFKKFLSFSKNEIKHIKNNFWDDTYLISAYTKNNELVNSNLYIKHGEKIIYFVGSLNTENHKSKAGFQMIFEAFKFFKSLGVKVYDFEGLADERDPKNFNDWKSFTEFKLKFSKEVIYYPKSIRKFNNLTFKQMVKLLGMED